MWNIVEKDKLRIFLFFISLVYSIDGAKCYQILFFWNRNPNPNPNLNPNPKPNPDPNLNPNPNPNPDPNPNGMFEIFQFSRHPF